MNRFCVIIALLAFNFATAERALAESGSALTMPQKGAVWLSGIEFLSGYSRGNNIRRKDDIQEIPLMLDIDLDLKPLLKKINFGPPVLTQFQIEPFISTIYEPVKEDSNKNNIESGVAFWFKFGLFPESWKLQPYVKFGAGLDYMTLHTLNESTQFNFISQLALGMHYFFLKNTALTLEGRYRHLSNAGIKEPNRGINSYFILGGIAYRY